MKNNNQMNYSGMTIGRFILYDDRGFVIITDIDEDAVKVVELGTCNQYEMHIHTICVTFDSFNEMDKYIRSQEEPATEKEDEIEYMRR